MKKKTTNKPHLVELKSRIKAFQAEIKAKNETFFKEAIAFLFEEFPALESFSWSQYTPYWNDGETCYFSANTDSVKVNDSEEDSWSLKYKLENLSPIKNEINKAALAKARIEKDAAVAAENFRLAEQLKGQIQKFEYEIVDEADIEEIKQKIAMIESVVETLQTFDDEVLKNLFGDHVEVTVRKDSVETSEYEHE